VIVLCSRLNDTRAALICVRQVSQFCDIMVDPAAKFEKVAGRAADGHVGDG
jgi:hypothetical protein